MANLVDLIGGESVDRYFFKSNNNNGQIDGFDLMKRVGDKEHIRIATVYDYQELEEYINIVKVKENENE